MIYLEYIIGLTLLEQILWGLLLVVIIYQFYFYIRYLCAPLRLNRKQNAEYRTLNKEHRTLNAERRTLNAEHRTLNAEYRTLNAGVSVVICAKNEAENLQKFLPAVLEQDYPLYEVIVVNDASEDNTAEVLAQFALQYKHLRLTFVPHGAQLRSSKKLALTLGIKAAQYDYILLTDADCRPASKYWIANMIMGFNQESRTNTTEIVLGYGAYLKEKTLVSRFIQYDTLFNGLQYMGLAIAHHPYMGVGRNLAYRKDTFFANKGFAGLLSSRAGDDDLFVNKIATSHNTQVVFTLDSLTWSVPKHSYRDWLLQKERHLGVSPQYKWGTKMRLFFEPFTRALFYATLIALCLLAPHWIWWAVAGGILLARLILQLAVLNTAAYRTQGQWFGLSVVFFDIFLPLNNLYLFIRYALRKRLYGTEVW